MLSAKSFQVKSSYNRCGRFLTGLILKRNYENSSKDIYDIPFSRAKVGEFVQEQPFHENAFLSDQFTIENLKRLMPNEVYSEIEPDLTNFGQRVSTDIWNLGQECAVNEPYLKQTTAWGQKVDEIVTCNAWKEQKKISAREGLIAIAYERKFAEFSRLYQVVKLSLFSPASGMYSCPLAMTDGAAKTIESHGLTERYHDEFGHLTTRDADKFWTSGQWMTEKRGGSDVAGKFCTPVGRLS